MLADADADGLDADTEDTEVPKLLSVGLAGWIAERGEGSGALYLDAPPSSKPPLHARPRRTLDAEIEDEAHRAFRAIGASHYCYSSRAAPAWALKEGLRTVFAIATRSPAEAVEAVEAPDRWIS